MKKIDFPRFFSERLQGFTHPMEDLMQVVDYDEVFNLDLSTGSFEVSDKGPEMFEHGPEGFLGRSDNPPLLAVGSKSVSYDFNRSSNSIEVRVVVHGLEYTITVPILPGDWFIASLSPCGRYLVVAEPYLIEVYALES